MNETSTAEHLPGESMTLEEWAAMPEDDEGELVDGVLVEEEEMPDLTHETVVVWLAATIRAWVVPAAASSSAPKPGSPWRRAAGASPT